MKLEKLKGFTLPIKTNHWIEKKDKISIKKKFWKVTDDEKALNWMSTLVLHQ